MAKTWIISEYYYPVVVTTGYYVTEIAEYLVLKGMDVGVITSNNTYYTTDVLSHDKYEVHNGVQVFRSIRRQIDKDNNKKRVLRLMSLSFSFFWMSLKRIKKGDKVIILTNPAFFLLFMPLVRFLTGCKYHILVHDIFPENLVAFGQNKVQGFKYRLIKNVFDKAYSKANSCISIGHDMSVLLESKVQGKSPIGLITNWADIDDVKPMPKEDTCTFQRFKSLAKDSVIFQFAGNLGKLQGIDNVLSAIKMVESKDAKFVFIGAGAKLEDVNRFAEKNPNTISLGFVSRNEQNDFLNACDVGIVTLADGMYGLGVPSKSYNIMATGRPILFIGEEDSEIALNIKKYNIGWVVPPNNPGLLKDQIEAILLDRGTIAAKGEKARFVAERVFSKTVVLEEYYQYIMR